MPALTTSRRRRLVALAALPAAALALWTPSFVAEIYDGDGFAGVPGGDYLTHPENGWRFLADAVRESRGTRLGTAEDALTQARDVWAGGRAVASDVRLVTGSAPFRVAIPAGGTAPAPAKAVARPRSGLSWVVLGHVDHGPLQAIGLVDYHSGRVVWNIRPVPPRAGR